ncbi:MAG TPA: hypothetical protein DEP51_06195, partial [Clostridiales bacterium]|nr:hypothetical protein [Clostridiales bacterium]
IFKIGFLDENIEEKIEDYKAFYDIVCTDNSSYFDLMEIGTVLFSKKAY